MIDCAPPSACALPETAEEMLAREKELSAHVEALTLFQKIKAEAFCTELALAEEQWGGNSRRLCRLLQMHHPLSPA